MPSTTWPTRKADASTFLPRELRVFACADTRTGVGAEGCSFTYSVLSPGGKSSPPSFQPQPKTSASRCSQLLRVRLLLSSLRAPATVVDPTSPLPAVLKQQTQNGPATSDVRLEDAVKLPKAVITEAEKAATVLTRICAHPSGTPAWQRYTERFSDRYGSGSHVPLEQLIDPDQGLGLPEGFGQMAEPPRPMTLRDRLLLELAGTATLEGRRSVNLSAPMIERLEAAAGTPALTPPHLEVCAHVRACSTHALKTGNFRLGVSYISRALGTMTGRFWHLDPTAQNNSSNHHGRFDASGQLSFHPLA